VLLWFCGGAWVLVWAVFQDPAIDYRLIMVGAVLPDLVDAPFGGARLFHSLAASVVLLVLVMLATTGRRVLRRRLLAVPIGMFLHLLLDGMWTERQVFWWPFQGGFGGAALPSLGHPALLTIAEELAGGAALVWCWLRFKLTEPERRAQFLRTGRLGRDIAGRPGPPC